MKVLGLDMDPEAAPSKPPSKHRDRGDQCQCVILIIVACLTLAAFVYVAVRQLIVDPDLNFGSAKFSMEPVSHAGIYRNDSSPAFNVTLHARSSYKHSFCSDHRGGDVQAVYSGITVAMGHVPPFCVEPKGSIAMTAAASSGWLAMPASLQERIDHDRRNGGVELEVDLSFANDIKGLVWVRCRAKLDATTTSPCKSFGLGYICL
ncbi:hypothetical protein CFC21_069949 [Triticum aestivum]|uniref:Late embryogenesis abundant protein LEA-2 subgroup domain-containing protein n=3 Tax=Triticum TaxID=4564 RepID=A0A9R1HCH5_WHEAT|nr:hypothetical protein CFC21_069946 [Triticum aestivum]KAF7063432.1 hypothetical protein CFC21_069949 [Triticum aestivum]VAI27212.1 unnamed protein product [Triticum turgidum subsp. durum]